MSGSIQGSFYKAATDISKGYLTLNMVMLKRLPVPSIRSIYFELQRELNIIRSAVVDLDDQDLIREKNLKISRITSAMRLIDMYCRQNRISK